MAKKQLQIVVSPVATAAYAWLAKPDEGQEYSDGKYKVTLVMDAKDKAVSEFIEDVREKSKAEAEKEWGKIPKNIRYCFKDGDDTDKEEFAGKVMITAKTKYQPGFVDAKKVPLGEEEFPASGDLVRASFALLPYKAGGNIGVTAQLRNVMLVEQRNFGGSPSNDFNDVEVQEDKTDEKQKDFDINI